MFVDFDFDSALQKFIWDKQEEIDKKIKLGIIPKVDDADTLASIFEEWVDECLKSFCSSTDWEEIEAELKERASDL